MKNLLLNALVTLAIVSAVVAAYDFTLVAPLKATSSKVDSLSVAIGKTTINLMTQDPTTDVDAAFLDVVNSISIRSVSGRKKMKAIDEIRNTIKVAETIESKEEDVRVLLYSYRVNDVLHRDYITVRDYDGLVLYSYAYFSSNPKYADSSEELKIGRKINEWTN